MPLCFAVPYYYRGMTVHAEQADTFDGIPSREKDPRKSLHLDEVPTPSLARARRSWR